MRRSFLSPLTSSVPMLLVALSLVGCGRTAGDAATATVSDPSTETPMLFPAAKGGSAFVVAAHPEEGTVSAFGPALPVDASVLTFSNVHVSADGKRVIALLEPKAGSSAESVVLLGDGATWTTLDHAPRLQLVDASDDLSLVATYHFCGSPAVASLFRVISADGTLLFGEETCAATATTTLAAFAPDGTYVVTRDANANLTLHGKDGQTHALSYGDGGGDGPASGEIVVRAFPTSLLLGQGQGGTHWVDTTGKSVDVAGWDPRSATLVGSNLAIVGSGIQSLGDRSITHVADVPAGVMPSQIVDARGGYVVATTGLGQFQVLDAHGAAVASYTPPAATATKPSAPVGTASINPELLAASTREHDAWSLFTTQYDTMTKTDAITYEYADNLWLFLDRDGAPTSRTLDLRRTSVAPGQSDTDGRGRAYASSSTGAHMLYVDGGVIHAVDVDSGTDSVLTSDFTIDAVDGSIQRHGR